MQENYFTRETLKAALEAKGINTNAEAQPVIDAMIRKGAIIQGVNEPKQTLSQKISGRVDNVKESVKQGLEAGSKLPTSLQDFSSGATKMINAGASIPGQVIAAAGDVVGAGLQTTGLDKPIAAALQPVANSDLVQRATQAFKTLPQETQDLLGNAFNIASVVPVGKVVGVGLDTTKAGVNAATNAVVPVVERGVSKVKTTVKPTTEQATQNTYNGIMGLVENKKNLLKNFVKSEGSGKDPIRIIAENPDYKLNINTEAKTIDGTDALANMKNDIADFSSVRDNLLTTADENLPLILTNKIFNDALTVFSNKNYSTYLDAGEKAVAGVIKKLKVLQKYNPDTVSRVALNEIRKGLDETINTFTDTKLADKVRLDLRKVFQENLENSIPESGLLKELNSKIGDIIDARNFTEKSLNGSKVKGGGLTDLAMKTAGTSLGAVGAGGVMGGIPGAIGGYFLSDFISKNLIKNAINNPFDRAVLEKLRSVRPEVVKRAEDIIQGSKSPGIVPVVK